MAKIGLCQPAHRNLAASDVWAKSSEIPLNKKMLNSAVKYIEFDPFISTWNYINSVIIRQNIELLFINKAELEPTVKKIHDGINEQIKKSKEK